MTSRRNDSHLVAQGLLLALLILTGCQPQVSTPDADPDQGTSLEKAAEGDFASQFAKEGNPNLVKQKVQEWTESYFAAHDLTEQFDQELERRLALKGAGDMEPMTSSPLYEQLNQVKALYQASQDDLMKAYQNSLERMASRDLGLRAQASTQVNLVYETLRTAWQHEPLARLAYMDLLAEMDRVQTENGPYPPLPKTSHEIQKFFKSQQRRDLERRFQEQRREVRERAKKSRLFFPQSPKQSLRQENLLEPAHHIKASAGEGGNLRGSEFPKGTWVLTFDDGPHPSITPALLNVLNENGVRATFFWLSKNARQYPQIVRATASSGHLIASHTASHPDLSRSNINHQREVIDAHNEIDQLSNGQISNFFRCPYGSCIFNGKTAGSRKTRELLAQNGIIHVLWNVDTLDWKPDSAETIYNRTIKQMQGLSRGIILFHDIHQRSLNAATRLIRDNLRQSPPASLDQAVREANKLQ